MNCHRTVLRYGLRFERGRKGRWRSGKVMKATADSAGDRREGEGRFEEMQSCEEKMRQRRRESKCDAKVESAL